MPEELRDLLVGLLLGDALVRIVVVFIMLLLFKYINISNQESLELILASVPLTGLKPLFVYSDLKSEKTSILLENKGKSGIYMWINKVNGKTYVGSSVDLSKRLRNYFKVSYLSYPKGIMLIYKALLAHGYDNFRLDILEYCEPSGLIKREQYYLDLLKPP